MSKIQLEPQGAKEDVEPQGAKEDVEGRKEGWPAGKGERTRGRKHANRAANSADKPVAVQAMRAPIKKILLRLPNLSEACSLVPFKFRTLVPLHDLSLVRED